jgi:hypothetical protein
MNWQMQPSSNASVVPGEGTKVIDIRSALDRIDGSFLRHALRGLVDDFEKANERKPLLDEADLVATEPFIVCQR